MKYPMYAMRDLKGNSFSPPECSVNVDTAKRTFDMRLHNDKSLGFSPADYELFCVGYFDPESGQVEGCLPEFIVNGGELF